MKKNKTDVADVQPIPDGENNHDRTLQERQTDLLERQNELLAKLVTAVDQLTIGYRVLNHFEVRVQDLEQRRESLARIENILGNLEIKQKETTV